MGTRCLSGREPARFCGREIASVRVVHAEAHNVGFKDSVVQHDDTSVNVQIDSHISAAQLKT